VAPERSGKARTYGHREIARMTLIRRARRFGFSLEEIRRWLDIYTSKGPRAQMSAALEQIDAQLSRLVAQREELKEMIRDLRDLRETVAASDV